jgi:rubrerythrin
MKALICPLLDLSWEPWSLSADRFLAAELRNGKDINDIWKLYFSDDRTITEEQVEKIGPTRSLRALQARKNKLDKQPELLEKHKITSRTAALLATENEQALSEPVLAVLESIDLNSFPSCENCFLSGRSCQRDKRLQKCPRCQLY